MTLGFAPYGAAIEERAAEAREAGHETALQAPMEDFSDGAGDLSPHLLKTSASNAENIESLRWLMSRFIGYVAVANHLGGKFTADPKEISPILTEIAARGLGYLDDGASPRSVAPDVAATLAMPWARADLVIDANPSPEAIEAALARLLDRARKRGSAIGVASASPISVELLARWANGLEAKGVALVPLSALMSAQPSPSAQTQTSPDERMSRELSYRPCVGVALINRGGEALIGHRKRKRGAEVLDARSWQMPQGGIDAGEQPLAAAKRELGKRPACARSN